MEPTNNPVFTNALARELWEKAQTPKPTALNTPLRYSSSYGCARQQSYAAFEVKPTEPMDVAGAWVTGLGTIIHEALQEAIGRKYPNAQFEVASGFDGVISGSCDALIPAADMGEDWVDGDVLYELKTMGTFSFDKQVGWNRMRGEFKYPEGPAEKAITQAGMNALGIERSTGATITWIVLGSITFEALSKQKATRMGVTDDNRILAEFWIHRDEWEPLAIRELERMMQIGNLVTSGYIADRSARDDVGNIIPLDPEGRAWQCEYCAFKTLCMSDGPGSMYITDSNAVPTNQGE